MIELEVLMSPKIVDKERKRTEIVLAAMKVFAQKGLKKSRMIDIAQEAGIGKGTVYDYFRSREEILVEAFNLVTGDLDKKIRPVLSESIRAADKIRWILRTSYDSLSQFPDDIMEIFVDFWSEGVRRRDSRGHPEIDLAEIYSGFRRNLCRVLDEGIENGEFRPMDTNAVSSILIAVIDGLLLQSIVDRKAFTESAIMDDSMDIILHGIRRNQTSGET
jgi:TetR/AcrR family fatty acid metabolism transcriptional regulator